MLTVKQASVYVLSIEDITRLSLPYVYFRYSLESRRPSETNMHARFDPLTLPFGKTHWIVSGSR